MVTFGKPASERGCVRRTDRRGKPRRLVLRTQPRSEAGLPNVYVLALLLLFALASSGCAHKKPAQAATTPSPRAGTQAEVVKNYPAGIVSRVAPVGRFVILTFPLAQMPAVAQRLDIYRQGVKVGEVRVSGPQRNNNIVADIVTGEPQVGDEVRAE